MTQTRDGEIVTFYSFKGGTGRTMALANVAWILAASGKRVLAVDWDLESPGLHRYFAPFLSVEAVRDTPGVIDMIREFDTAARREKRRENLDDLAAYAQVNQYTLSLDWSSFPEGGALDYMSCGRQNMDYATTIGSLGWDNFYDKLQGGRLFTMLRADMKANYDYTLIDSRTGFSDIANICTFHLPDTLVNCFTLNTQGIDGAVKVASDLYRQRGAKRRIRILPVPMRVENTEKAKADAGHSLARRRFDELPADLNEQQRDQYWANVVIPYQPFYAYEETLATFGDARPGPQSLLGAYERLTDYISHGEVTAMPPMEALVREHWLKRFERGIPSDVSRVLLDYEPEDEVWAEWVERVLRAVKIDVASHRDDARPAQDGGAAPLLLTIVSKSSSRQPRADWPADRTQGTPTYGNHRAVYVADVRPLNGFPADLSEHLVGQTASGAANRLTKLVGCDPVPDDALRTLSQHYPGNEPGINSAPIRNPQFTGRTEALRQLRSQLREQRTVAILPVTLRSGVGKSQLALEYVHRYKSEYDVIWWIQSGQPQFVDTSIVDLGAALTRLFSITVGAGPGASAEDDALAVLNSLSQGRPTKRWLLVFDNANDAAVLRKFIPSGEGHTLITSRTRNWDQLSSVLDIDVFDREESIAHLRQRAPEISPKDADLLAHALGDLPFAVSLTGAWLSETATPVVDHLRNLEQHGPLALPDESPLVDYPETLVTVLDSSLAQVLSQSSAAHRILQLCSCMSGESIALGLVYSPAMVSLLEPFDPTLTEPNDIARHVQQLNRLALIKLDNHARQFHVHRLLQARTRQLMTEEELALARHEVHTLLASNRPRRDVDDPDTRQRYQMLWPHLGPSGAAQCRDEHVRTLMIDRVRYMWIRGPLSSAAVTGRTLRDLWQARLDKPSQGDDTVALRKQLLHLSFNLANILRDQAQYDEAWKLDTRVLDEQRELLGPQHRHTLMTASGLAADLRARGKYQDALKLAEETHFLWNEVFGEDFGRTLDAANNLAVSYRLAGRYADARALDDTTYERRRTTQGERHPRTAAAASAIGRNLREAGQYAESVSWLRDLLATTKSQPDASPRTVAEIQVNLAASLRAAGRFSEAVPHINEAFDALNTLLDDDHAETLACRMCRCANLLAADDYAKADRELRTVLSAYRRLVGPDHPLTLAAASNHVAILRSIGASEEALATARETVDKLWTVLDRDHPYTLAAEMNLAVCLADSGRLAESRFLDERTAELLAEMLGAGHPDALRAAANLALTRESQGDQDAAEDLALIIDRLGARIGREHPSVVALQNGIRNHRVLDPQPF